MPTKMNDFTVYK